MTPTLPADSVPVDYRGEPNKYVIPYTVSTLTPDPLPNLPPYTWHDYMATLPEWEKDLLSSIQFVDRRRLLHSLRSDENLFMASDGGVTNQQGSFGAVIATSDHILIECGGRAHGTDPRPFRAEGYGILAILRLAFHLRYFYLTGNAPLQFRLYCDSAASQRLSSTLPRRFLFSEVDVKMQILSAMQAGSLHVVFEDVEGHQYTKYPERPLSWAAQLNMRCDEI
jgi:hypothetical protein